MPEEKIQAEKRNRVDHVDIRPRELTQRNNNLAENNTQTNDQPPEKKRPNIAKKRRALQKSKRRASRHRFNIRRTPKKLVGFGFWMIVGVAVFKELLDPFIFALQSFTDISIIAGVSVGAYTGSAYTGIIAGVFAKTVSYFIPPVALLAMGVEMAFKLLWWFIGVVATIAASFAIWYYLVIVNGVSFGVRKLSIFMVVFLVEAVPVLNLVPSTVLALFIIRKMENSNQQSRFIRVAKKRYR